MTDDKPDYCSDCPLAINIARVEGRLDELSKRLNHSSDEILWLKREIENKFRWMVGITISTWLSLLVIVIAV
jgi:hypothetical protein